jgi:hypothetical protein
MTVEVSFCHSERSREYSERGRRWMDYTARWEFGRASRESASQNSRYVVL